MFDFYFAGYSDNEINNKIIELDGNILISYYRDKKTMQKLIQKRTAGWKGKLIVDSGAFTAHRADITIDIDEYCRWIDSNEPYVFKFVNLDVIPGKWGKPRTVEDTIYGQQKSFENFDYIVNNVKCPQKILPVFHQGENLEYLGKYLDYKIDGNYLDYICISGRKDMSAKSRQEWYTSVYDYIKNSNNPNIKTHILGSALKKDAELFPCTSMDATTWIKQPVYGNIVGPCGTIYVGDKNLILNSGTAFIDALNEQLNEFGLTLDEVADNANKRILFSIYGLYKLSKMDLYKGYSSRKRRLF